MDNMLILLCGLILFLIPLVLGSICATIWDWK